MSPKRSVYVCVPSASTTRKREPSFASDFEQEFRPGTCHKKRKARSIPILQDSDDENSFEQIEDDKFSSWDLNPPEEPTYHVQKEDEFVEDANFQVIGETDPVEYSNAEENGVPVRVLADFSIYEAKTQRLVPIAELIGVNYGMAGSYAASGCVKAWTDNDDNWVDDDQDFEEETYTTDFSADYVQRVKLTRIMKFTLHDMKRQGRGLDSKLYILSPHAWYILDEPSSAYRPFFLGFWLRHRVLHLLVDSVMKQPRLKYEEFVQMLNVTPESPEDVSIALKMLGRSITEEDLQDDGVKSYILSALEELRQDEQINIRRAPVVRSLLGQEISYEGQEKNPRQLANCSSPANVELQVLEHCNKTVVTPTVGRVAEIFFAKNIVVSGTPIMDSAETNSNTNSNVSIVHLANPNMVKWLEPAAYAGYYQSVLVDGVIYSVGDTVMVEPGVDENHARAKNYAHLTSRSTNSLANTCWFCQIQYLFEDKHGRKKFHAQWLTHSSKTLLQEVGHPQALYFMLNDCEDIDVDAICQMCNVQEIDPDAHEPSEANIIEENDFHCRLMFNSTDASFVSLSAEQILHALAHCDEHQQCLPCGLRVMKQSIAHARPLPGGGYAQHEFSYHTQDFVYIKCPEPHSVYKIGQILKVKAMKAPIEVTVQLFGRYDDIIRKLPHNEKEFVSYDDRRIFITNTVETVYSHDIEGLCYVIHSYNSESIDNWVKDDNHYYVNQMAPSTNIRSLEDLHDWSEDQFQCCKKCKQEHEDTLHQHSKLLQRHGRLRAMELFSGAGGLGTGFGLSGFVETRWAIEFSPSAAQTYQHNHPETVVYNQCTNLCLQSAIDTLEGKITRPLFAVDGKKQLPPMPKQGEVDFIYGGPPCQSFSLMNHNKKDDDIRSTLICNMLSYVEFYRPMYLLLENVYGLMVHTLKPSSKDQVQLAVVKFIQRALVSIGYQSRFTVLQAAQFGVPQGRRRVIFWAARQDVLLPDWPLPTHCSPSKSCKVQLPFGSTLPPISRNKNNSQEDDRSAPLHFVTINEAIGDLPPFDWINPHETSPATSMDRKEAKKRESDLGIPSFSALSVPSMTWVGYPKPCRYHTKPLSRFQKWMRQSQDGRINTSLSYHYTRCFSSNVVERVCSVPMRAGANHSDLPRTLRMKLAEGKPVAKAYKGLYRRLDGNALFATALTSVAPNSKAGTVLHPSQKRILSVRECARAQGFPDHYQFLSVNKTPTKILGDQLRQIGNAVPVPLAYALGKSLGRALLKMWEDKEREGSPEL